MKYGNIRKHKLRIVGKNMRKIRKYLYLAFLQDESEGKNSSKEG
jgi:hypothetical protein